MRIFKGKHGLLTPTTVAVVASKFNQEVTDILLEGALAELKRAGIPEEKVLVFRVPGAWEIPYASRLAVKQGNAKGVICLGALIRGETAHFDYIATEASSGISRASEELDVPMTFGVLTCENKEQALARAGGSVGHMGIEAAQALLELLSIREQLSAQTKLQKTKTSELNIRE
ncbi:6,7-dimethyl-8-ribityllumazine synthase [Bdellovibrionota bacterium]